MVRTEGSRTRVGVRPARLWRRISHLGVPRLAEIDTRSIIATNQLCAVSATIGVAYGILMFAADWPRQNAPGLVFLALAAVWALALAVNGSGHHLVAAALALFAPIVGLGYIAVWFTTEPGFQYYLLTIGVLSFVLLRPEQYVVRTLLIASAVGALLWTEVVAPPSQIRHVFSDRFVAVYLALNICLTAVLLYIVGRADLLYYERERRRNEELLLRARVAAQTDALTEVYNRRGIAPILSGVTRRSDYALALVDLDRFKTINDKLGHGSGDVVLANAARTLVQSVGDAGVVARWGGEEFLVVIPGVSLNDADALMEKARADMEAEYGAPGSPARVTISVGLAHAPRYTPKEEVLRLADANLYEAKSSGRNIVVSARLASEED